MCVKEKVKFHDDGKNDAFEATYTHAHTHRGRERKRERGKSSPTKKTYVPELGQLAVIL